MAKIQPVWAIDIGQAALKALKVLPGDEPDTIHAEAFDFVEYPKILSQPDADAEQLVRDALTTFLERNDLKGCRVAIGVSGQAGLVKFVKLPPVEKSRIPDIVKFEARQHIPFALDEVIWDYQRLGGDGSSEEEDDFSMVEVGLFAMKRDQINRAIVPLKNAGVEVDIVQMSPLALYNFIAFDNPPPAGESKDATISYVLLDVGADNTDLIITDGIRIWQRNVPIGGNHFTRALSKEMKQTFAKAEHLKRNATKAQDAKTVFTAMRGVFSDFASEVTRSIGFYSSVNRNAKIAKVIGLGNGFKLAGMKAFLDKNVDFEVAKLERFNKLVGDEVVKAPQFEENLPSFAVAYGLGVQGLGMAPMKTNLLPPEIEQVRMIRRKKPWALAASTLLMLGLSALFMSAWGALAKTKPLEAPAKEAQTVADQANKYINDFTAAKGAFTSLKGQGDTLVANTPETASWPGLLQTVMATLPNPAQELKDQDPTFDPTLPANIPIVGMLRVHIDKILPVWREDLKTEWFDELDPKWQTFLQPYDFANPPSGAGWVVQVVGHHYNPSARTKDLGEREKKIAKGPEPYISQEILPRFWDPRLRLLGIHHAVLTSFHPDSKWTTEKGASAVPPPPLLARAEAAVVEGAGTDAGGGMASSMMYQMGKMAGAGGMGMGMGMSGGQGMGMMESMMRARGGMAGMMEGRGGANDPDKMDYLTRTDFKIEFIWQPPNPEDLPKTDEERIAKIQELAKSIKAENEKKKGSIPLDEAALAQLSQEQSKKALDEAVKEEEAAAAAASGEAPAAAVQPGAVPAPAAPATDTPK